jgi:uncharacterized Zn-binding protein involved in type VI secretion
MQAIVTLGGTCTGHGGFGSRPNDSASSDTFINNKPIHRQGDHWVTHCSGKPCHDSTLASGSSNLCVNGKAAGRVGDPIACGSVCATGSKDTFSG